MLVIIINYATVLFRRNKISVICFVINSSEKDFQRFGFKRLKTRILQLQTFLHFSTQKTENVLLHYELNLKLVLCAIYDINSSDGSV